jgi:hypothetical protein
MNIHDKARAMVAQAVRIELARGIWYKPDFFLPHAAWRLVDGEKQGYCIAYECKGPKVFRGGFENLKMAARVHGAWIKFYLVWEDINQVGGWARQEILA